MIITASQNCFELDITLVSSKENKEIPIITYITTKEEYKSAFEKNLLLPGASILFISMGPIASLIESTTTSFKTLVIFQAKVYNATYLSRVSVLRENLSIT